MDNTNKKCTDNQCKEYLDITENCTDWLSRPTTTAPFLRVYTELTRTDKPISLGDKVGQLELELFVEKGCNHEISIKLINGNYVSYCMRCGKIFEEKKIKSI